jgi:calcineurin-like phosphoesterase family protein
MKRKLFFTSDWHVGHAKAIVFDERPFRDLDHMHATLIKNFNYWVPKHGITYFLGDMGFGPNDLLGSIIRQLNGTKILVRGNHDRKMDAMYNAGFDVVIEKAQITIGNDIVTMTHCPLKGVFREDTTGMRGCDGTENWHKERKHGDYYSIEDFGQFHLHGHIHSGPANNKKKIDGRQMDVGVPAWNYRPVRLSEVQSWIDTYKKKNTEA